LRATDFLKEDAPRVGRTIQHLEDLVYIDGIAGAKHALDILRNLAKDTRHMTIKWDGSPAVIFGRDVNGQFHFADQYAKQPITNAKDLYNMFLSRGKNVDDTRKAFAQDMADIYSVYESATPRDFRGYVKADLLYKSTPELNKNNEYEFQPNVVKYFVQKDSPLGKKIGQSRSGAAIVGYMKEFNGPSLPIGNVWQKLTGNPAVAIFPPTVSTTTAKLDTRQLDAVGQKIASNGASIEQFIAPETGLTDIRNIIYSYVNSQVDVPGGLEKLGANFPQWVAASTKISQNKKDKIQTRIQQNTKGVLATFDAVREIMSAKENIIDQLESPTLSSIGMRAELPGGQPGGEGLVSATPKGGLLKFVKRGGFTAASRAAH